jgi:hypothetical protein
MFEYVCAAASLVPNPKIQQPDQLKAGIDVFCVIRYRVNCFSPAGK